jgi:crossover junction endodeoxyribonuclease RusA
MIQFTAYGIPAPKGSTKAFYRPGMRFPIVTEDNAHTRPWAAIVKDAALQEMIKGQLLVRGDPMYLYATFHMPRPKSLPKKTTHHCKKPDLDKLLRAVKDALTGIVWEDDSQVILIMASKVYVENGGMPRVEIRVEDVAERREFKPMEYRKAEERLLFS